MGDPGSDLVISALETVWGSTAGACAGLGAADWDLPTECPGWSVRDQLSHVIGIERTLMGEPAPLTSGPVPAHVRNPIGEMNEAWVGARRSLPGPDVLAEFESVTAQRIEALRAMTHAEFDVVGWSPAGQVPYREFMVLRVFDSWVHEQDVRRALGRPGGRGGVGEAMSLDRVAGAMGYVIGRKVSPPDGTTVVFEVTGPLPRTVAVEMREGRGEEPADLPDIPSARITLDAESFWRLGCGRIAAEPTLNAGSVALVGDAALGRRVLGAMDFLI